MCIRDRHHPAALLLKGLHPLGRKPHDGKAGKAQIPEGRFHHFIVVRPAPPAAQKILLQTVGADVVARVAPVSYTHLDVYKRQTQSSVKCLYQARLSDGTLEKLKQYDQPTILLGAYDQKLVLEHNNDSYLSAVADVFEVDVTTGQETQLFHYEASGEMADEYNPAPHAVAFSHQHYLYILEPAGGRTAQLSRRDLRTGEEQTVAESVPYYGSQVAEDGCFLDGKLLLTCSENTGDGMKGSTFAIDLESGSCQEVTLSLIHICTRGAFGRNDSAFSFLHLITGGARLQRLHCRGVRLSVLA